jgi:hypothetical protein
LLGGSSIVAKGIEVDWVLVHVNTIRRLAAIAVIGLVAGALVVFAYLRLNLPPDVRAREAIERAEAAREQVLSHAIPDNWRGELEQAENQLEEAQTAYVNESWEEAITDAESAEYRFEALLGAGKNKLVGVGQFFSLEGRVTVQRAGKAEWQPAHQRMPVFNGDFVKSARDGTAEILFVDGSLYRISPNSLLEIHHQQKASDESGRVKMVVGRINVYTSGSSSTVTTDTAETHIQRDSQVALGVDEGGEGTTVAAFKGSARVRNPKGAEVVVGAREQVAATADGAFTEKRRIPNPPSPEKPVNNAVFELRSHPVIELAWRVQHGTSSVHLQVSRSKHFADGRIDVDAPGLRKTTAKLGTVAPGTYFWRVAGMSDDAVRSEWSAVQRFRIYSADRQTLLRDRTPPDLVLQPPQQLGHMFIVEGRTEAGASVTINGEPVEVDSGGNFRKAVEVRDTGWTELVVAAVDPSGNRTERREKVNVEVY